MKKLVFLVAALAASVSAFAFQPGMTAVQIRAEVAQRSEKGESIASIVADGIKAKISAPVLQAALAAVGKDSQAVFTAMLNAGFDPANLLPPTAAGGDTAAAAPTAAGGFAGSSFSQSRASTVGGGGSTAVSPS